MTAEERSRSAALEVLAIMMSKAFSHIEGPASDYRFWERVFNNEEELIKMINIYHIHGGDNESS